MHNDHLTPTDGIDIQLYGPIKGLPSGKTWLKETRSLNSSESMVAFSDVLLEPFVRKSSSDLHNAFPYRRFLAAKKDGKVVARIALFARYNDQCAIYPPSALHAPSKAEHSVSEFHQPPHFGQVQADAGEEGDPESLKSARSTHSARAFFGFFFVAPNSQDAGLKLMRAAINTLRADGYRQLKGPVSIHPILGAGLFAETTGTKPLLYQPQNVETQQVLQQVAGEPNLEFQPHYTRLWGWQDTYEFPALLKKMADATKANPRLTIRPFDVSRATDLAALVTIYNDARAHDPGHVPLTLHEVEWAFRDTALVDQRLSFLAHVDGEPAGCILVAENIKPVEILRAEEVFGQLPRRLFNNIVGKKYTLRVFVFSVRHKFRAAAVGGLTVTLWHEMLSTARELGHAHMITPQVPIRDFYRVNIAKLLNLRPERTFSEFSMIFE